MIYGIIRILISVCFLVTIFFFIKRFLKSPKKRKIAIILLFFVGVAFCAITFLFPIENFVWTFSSPEAVFKYAGTGEIVDVIDGKHSCMIIYSNGRNSYSTMIAHKDANGYKLPSSPRSLAASSARRLRSSAGMPRTLSP